MRSLIRQFIYVAIPLYLLQTALQPFEFGENYVKTFVLVALAIALVMHFVRPLLKIISFPIGGFGYIFLLGLVVASCLYALQSFMPDFKVKSFFVPQIDLFGVSFGNVGLEGFKALLFLGFAISICASLFGWIMG